MQSGDLDKLARELKQPIDALGLLARALRRRTADPQSEEILDDIEIGLRQVRRQLASFLDLIRAENCLSISERIEFPLLPLFEKLMLQIGRLAYDNGVRVSVVATGVRVVSDPAAVELILRNLLVNALFYARGGRVLLGCRRLGRAVQIQICDNGVGIPPEHQSLIFEPLEKLNGDGDELMQGLGLGLSIARDLAQTLGHALELRSTPSRGSVFSLTLPLAADQSSSRN